MTTRSDSPVRPRFSRALPIEPRNLPKRGRFARTSGEHGSSLVEMALAAAMLFIMLFGMMEISLALYTYHFVSEAAREGTRFAIVRGSSCVGLTGGCPATSAQIQTYVQNLGFPGINPSAMTVSTAWSAYPAGGSCTPLATCNNPSNMVKITVSYQYPLSIPFIQASILNMTSSSQMVISQ